MPGDTTRCAMLAPIASHLRRPEAATQFQNLIFWLAYDDFELNANAMDEPHQYTANGIVAGLRMEQAKRNFVTPWDVGIQHPGSDEVQVSENILCARKDHASLDKTGRNSGASTQRSFAESCYSEIVAGRFLVSAKRRTVTDLGQPTPRPPLAVKVYGNRL
jgi:hypothetical protein